RPSGGKSDKDVNFDRRNGQRRRIRPAPMRSRHEVLRASNYGVTRNGTRSRTAPSAVCAVHSTTYDPLASAASATSTWYSDGRDGVGATTRSRMTLPNDVTSRAETVGAFPVEKTG